MALHTQLPIYKVAYGLFDVIMDLAKNMPRDFKASIGGKLRDECIEILTLIFRANVAREKTPHLGTLIERLQVAEDISPAKKPAAKKAKAKADPAPALPANEAATPPKATERPAWPFPTGARV